MVKHVVVVVVVIIVVVIMVLYSHVPYKRRVAAETSSDGARFG
jgi:uncharacterized protein YqfA (UPF0365 family)